MTASDPTLSASPVQWDRFIYRLANRYARTLGAEREDVRHDIILAVVAKYPSYDPSRSAFPTWLAVVARTVVSRAIGRRNRAVRLVSGAPTRFPERDDEDDTPLVSVLADPKAADPAETAERDELVDQLLERLADLTPAQREAVTARFWRGTGALGPDRREHLDRAIELLREQLAPHPSTHLC